MIDVGIMVVAQNIDKKIKNRFQECIIRSKPECTFNIHFLSASDEEVKGPFNKSKILNNGIKTLTKMNYKVIIQTDIDLIIPPGLIDKTLEIGIQPKTCFYNCHRRIDPKRLPKLPDEYDKMNWEKLFDKFIFENANGCWNGMTPESWLESGGYNEYMIEWGREDDVFRTNANRYGNIKFINYNKFCLIHVNHPPRTRDFRKYNNAMERKASLEGKKNWLI